MMEDSDEPEIFYDEIIMPYKGLLEEWFVENISLLNYFKCIFMTVVKICRPESELVWVLFPNLPPPPEHDSPEPSKEELERLREGIKDLQKKISEIEKIEATAQPAVATDKLQKVVRRASLAAALRGGSMGKAPG